MEIKSFKMKVNPEQSRMVQEVLFKNGYKWGVCGTEVRCADKPYLFLISRNSSKPTELCWSESGSFFIEDVTPELTFEEFMGLYSEKKSYPKVCIKGDGTEEYGKKIIKHLESLGGFNFSGMGGVFSQLYYFIDYYSGYIQGCVFIPEGYTEISLKEDLTHLKQVVADIYNESPDAPPLVVLTKAKEILCHSNCVPEQLPQDDFPLIEHKILRL